MCHIKLATTQAQTPSYPKADLEDICSPLQFLSLPCLLAPPGAPSGKTHHFSCSQLDEFAMLLPATFLEVTTHEKHLQTGTSRLNNF